MSLVIPPPVIDIMRSPEYREKLSHYQRTHHPKIHPFLALPRRDLPPAPHTLVRINALRIRNHYLYMHRPGANETVPSAIREFRSITDAARRTPPAPGVRERIALYSHYSSDGSVEPYNYTTLQVLIDHVDKIYILTNTPASWNTDADADPDLRVIPMDQGQDFSNYYTFIIQNFGEIYHASELYFVNDSFLVADPARLQQRMSGIGDRPYWGAVLSIEIAPHYQSFFIRYRGSTVQAVADYLAVLGPPNESTQSHNAQRRRDYAVCSYELGIPAYLVTAEKLRFAKPPRSMRPFNPCIFAPGDVVNAVGIIKRQHLNGARTACPHWAHHSLLNTDRAYIKHLIKKYASNQPFVQYCERYLRTAHTAYP
jgi:hypothetical protein